MCQPGAQGISALTVHVKLLTDSQDGVTYLNPCCNFSFASEKSSVLSYEPLPVYSERNSELLTTDVLTTIEKTVDALDASLRDLSLSIHGECLTTRRRDTRANHCTEHPELMFQEKYVGSLEGDVVILTRLDLPMTSSRPSWKTTVSV